MQRISTTCLYLGIVGIIVSALAFAFEWLDYNTKIDLLGSSIALFNFGLTGLLVKKASRFFKVTSLTLGLFGSFLIFLGFNHFLPLNQIWSTGVSFISLGLIAGIYSQIQVKSWISRLIFMQSALGLILLSMAYLFKLNMRYFLEIGTLEFLIFSVFAIFQAMKTHAVEVAN